MARLRSRIIDPWVDGSTAKFGGTFGETMWDDATRILTNKPCTHSRIRVIQGAGSFWATYHGGPKYFYFQPPGRDRASLGGGFWVVRESSNYSSGSFPPSPKLDVLGDLNTEIQDEIREAGRSSFFAVSFLRELNETIGMLKSPLRAATWVARHVGNLGKRPRTLKQAFKLAHANVQASGSRHTVKTAGNAWLEGTYGWNPFVSDMLSLAEVCGGAVSARRNLIAEGSRPFSLRRAGQIDNQLKPGDPSYLWYASSGRQVGSFKAKYYGRLTVNPSVQAESILTSIARSVNLDRLGYSLWDAVPYSFVADWFLPLGNTIDDLATGPAFYIFAETPWVSYTQKLSTRVEIRSHGPGVGGDPRYVYGGSGSYGESAETFERYPANLSDIAVNSSTGMHGTRIVSGLFLAEGLISRLGR